MSSLKKPGKSVLGNCQRHSGSDKNVRPEPRSTGSPESGGAA